MLNSAPLGHDTTVSMLENTAHVFSVPEFGFTDPNESPPNHFTAVEITTTPDKGALTNRGQPVTAAQFIPVSDISAGNLRFTPASSATGSPYTLFTFQVQDDGGTVSGSDLDPTPRTLTIVVSVPPCQPPVGTNVSVSLREDTAYTFQTSDFPLSACGDVSLASVQIVTTPSPTYYGSVRLNGVALAAGARVSAMDIAGGKLQFLPGADGAGSPLTSFQVQITDSSGGTSSVPTTIAANVTSVNDPPLSCMWPTVGGASIDTESMGGRAFYIAAVEDTTYHFSTSDFGFCDPYDSPANAFLNLIITLLPTSGTLTLGNMPITSTNLPVVVPVSSLQAGMLSYAPPVNANGYFWGPGFKLQDNGGTINGGQDTSAANRQVEFHIYPVNNPPVGHDNTVTTFEQQSYMFTAADFGFNDPNDVFPVSLTGPNNLKAVRITTLPGRGVLMDGNNPVAVGQFISVSELNGGLLRFAPSANANGSPYASFTFQVQDDGGTAMVSGGYSSAIGLDLDFTPKAMSITVIGVNHAPQGSDGGRAIYDDASYSLKVGDFGFSDLNDSPPNNFKVVIVATPPARGALTDGGILVNAGQVIPVGDIAQGKLVFTPEPGVHYGPDPGPYTSFTFQVQDDGGTSGGGADTDPVARTLQIDLYDGPSAPVGADSRVTTAEDQAYTFQPADFKFSDPNDFFPNNFVGVRIATLPTLGVLTNGGNLVAAGDFVPIVDLALGQLQLALPADASGAAVASFTFQVQDDGETAFGGSNFDPTPRTMTVDVLASNRPPTFTAGSNPSVTDESGSQVVQWATQILAGPPSEAGQAVQFVIMSNSSPELFAVQPAIDSAGKLTFTPAANVSGMADIEVVLQDDGGTAGGGSDTSAPQMLTIHVAKAHAEHNAIISTDVTGDGHTAPNDAAAVINFINAFGSQRVSGEGEAASLYYDVNADGFIAPNDALSVINQINAFGESEGEGQQLAAGQAAGIDDLIAMLAVDVATQVRKNGRGN